MKKPVLSQRINGRRIGIKTDELLDGYWEDGMKGPEFIWINGSLEGRERLETIIHEVTHVFFPKAHERTVLTMGYDLSRLLWRLGYRPSE